MHIFVKLAAGAAAIGGLATPALAQYQPYPQYQQTYPQTAYPQQVYQQGYGAYGQQGYAQNPVQSIIDQLLGNRYQANDRTKIAQCAAAAQAQAVAQYRPNAYGQQRYNGYNGYSNNAYGSSARVTGITNVERRGSGLRISGVMSSGMQNGAYGAYGQQQGYNRAYAAGANDLTFRCNVDYRGAVTGVRVRPNMDWRR